MLGRAVADEVGVPPPYLAKVLAKLARAGVVTASRGVGGGYRLARPAEEIRLAEIVEPFEGKRAIKYGCLFRPGKPCGGDRMCSAHRAWSRVQLAYDRFLDSTTLADIRGAAAGEPPPPQARWDATAHPVSHAPSRPRGSRLR